MFFLYLGSGRIDTAVWMNYMDLPEAMNDREKWREGVRDIRASGT